MTTPVAEPQWAGHPKGLSTLFFTEMWERFSYYGMRAFLILYMVNSLGFADAKAGSIYGTYTMMAWFASIAGGIIADRWLGPYRTVFVGGCIITAGHFTLAFPSLPTFYLGLVLIVIGTGMLKPNVSILVGSLYAPDDDRRDAGFSLFYMGINLGAFLGPLIAGYLAQQVNWHYGFAAAGVGMALGLVQYVRGKKHLEPGIARIASRSAASATSVKEPLTTADWKRIGAIVAFFIAASLFWGGYEQAGSSLNLFADRYVDRHVFGFEFPASWYISVQAGFVIILSPIFAWMWLRLGSRQPSSPAKFAFALLFVGLAFLLLVPGGKQAMTGTKISPWWLVGAYFIEELGELSLSPVGLSVVTKLSPTRIVGLMMGVWFLSNAAGNKIAGWTAQFVSTVPLDKLFLINAAVMIGAAVVMFLLIKPVRRLMGGVN